jgi:hypothetical protein
MRDEARMHGNLRNGTAVLIDPSSKSGCFAVKGLF